MSSVAISTRGTTDDTGGICEDNTPFESYVNAYDYLSLQQIWDSMSPEEKDESMKGGELPTGIQPEASS